jgi:hypothetical protein
VSLLAILLVLVVLLPFIGIGLLYAADRILGGYRFINGRWVRHL